MQGFSQPCNNMANDNNLTIIDDKTRQIPNNLKVILNTTFGKGYQVCGYKGEWCAAYIDFILNTTLPQFKFFNGVNSASCNAQISWFKEKGFVREPNSGYSVKIGDIIYYDWDHADEPLPADHVGIITGIKPETQEIYVQEGNFGTDGWKKTKVARRTIKITSEFVFKIVDMSYYYKSVISEVTPVYLSDALVNERLERVRVFQHMLNLAGDYNLETDGYFGPQTASAVKNFQAKNNLTPDGVVGYNTMIKLMNTIYKFPNTP